jgi:DNA modification methylase
VIERERTNNNGLLHKTVMRDRSQVRQGMADYLLVFRKRPLETDGLMSAKPIATKGFDRYIGQIDPRVCKDHPSPFARKSKSSADSIDIWQRYADPVWFDINQTNVLNHKEPTSENDVKHICPLQLDLIERAVHIWSDEKDVVLSPFAGIGSEGVGALRLDRRFVGFELKPEYFDCAAKNLRMTEQQQSVPTLF